MKPIIAITNGVTRHPRYRMATPINFTLEAGEHIAVVGPNGGGKSILVDVITGKYPLLMDEVHYDFTPSLHSAIYQNIKYITFRDTYGDSEGNYYYQQRWNSQDMEVTPLVRDLLPPCADIHFQRQLFTLFGVDAMLDKHIVLLSSGELRKFQLTKTLLTMPRVLIMDNPFIGLDAATRNQLHELLNNLTALTTLQVILVLSKTDEIPTFITHVVPVGGMTCGAKMAVSAYKVEPYTAHILTAAQRKAILDLPYGDPLPTADEVVGLHNVTIRYGTRTILNTLDWQVKRGEKWALMGENGAGKSTLLSLICCDNPQSYACDITLFGHRRGTGESIWEIKKHIGYVSPEMHRAYLKSLPTIDIVASGLHDSVGLYKRPTEAERAQCHFWLDIFGIASLRDRDFLQLSSGEQRLALLARAFVKDPSLLILDEPLHGLDLRNRRLAKDVIEAFCARKGKTLIMVTHYRDELPSIITQELTLSRCN